MSTITFILEPLSYIGLTVLIKLFNSIELPVNPIHPSVPDGPPSGCILKRDLPVLNVDIKSILKPIPSFTIETLVLYLKLFEIYSPFSKEYKDREPEIALY